MTQRTCNIIMICKHWDNKYHNKNTSTINAIAKYMGDECKYPCDAYSYEQMEDILLTALYDFIDGADKPSFELRRVFDTSVFAPRSLLDRICLMFSQTQVKDKKGYVNGFAKKQLDKADEILGIEREVRNE